MSAINTFKLTYSTEETNIKYSLERGFWMCLSSIWNGRIHIFLRLQRKEWHSFQTGFTQNTIPSNVVNTNSKALLFNSCDDKYKTWISYNQFMFHRVCLISQWMASSFKLRCRTSQLIIPKSSLLNSYKYMSQRAKIATKAWVLYADCYYHQARINRVWMD
jgi:hypothetical protein